MSRKTAITTIAAALALMALVPGIATGHHEPGHDEPVPKRVIVANDASQAIPTEVEGIVEVQQAGPFEVHFEDDWNSAGDPVHVYEQPHQPFQYYFQQNGDGCHSVPIPEGRTLEVQSVSVGAGPVSEMPGQPPVVTLWIRSGDEGTALAPAGAIEMFLHTDLEEQSGTTYWHGSLTGLTLFAGRMGAGTALLLVCPQPEYDIQGTVSGRLE